MKLSFSYIEKAHRKIRENKFSFAEVNLEIIDEFFKICTHYTIKKYIENKTFHKTRSFEVVMET